MIRRRSPLLALLTVVIAGCGGGSHQAKPEPPKPAPTVAQACQVGTMGCSLRTEPSNRRKLQLSARPAGCLFPDVYEGQGNVDWGAVAAWQDAHHCPRAAALKLGEFRTDVKAARNASETARLHFWRTGYWFMHRGVGADQIAAVARALGIKIITLDIEVPDAAGTGALVGPLRAMGFTVIIYTAPGTWPGGPNGNAALWIATFGSSFCRTCLWTASPAAWQFTDGQFGAVTQVPGIAGNDDVNVDLGITRLGGQPQPAIDPYAKYPNVPIHFGADHARERVTVKTWDRSKCRNPVRRTVCKTTRTHLELLAGRILFLAHHDFVNGRWVPVGKPRWSAPSKQIPFGSRYAGINRRLNVH